MADTGPSKSDIQAVFKRLRAINTNKVCFDCDAKNPTWASVTYGVFICIDCSATHRSLGVHVSFVRSTQLDTNWTWLQLRAMQVGGNASAFAFFTQHNCTTKDAQQKYNSRAAQLYKERLHHLASQAMRLHGTLINIDTHHDSTSPQQKDVDFFQEHAEAIDELVDNATVATQPQPIKNGTLSHPGGDIIKDGPAPSVEAALSVSPTRAQAEPRKTTIGSRKAPQQKKGLGGKKGLGAQKVNTNFSQIEKEAQMADERKMSAINEATKAKTKEEEEEQIQSMRLAYRDISLEKQNQEDKLKQVDPKKAAQFERLGMGGFGSQKGVAHSAMTDMKVIQQETPISEKQRYHGRSRRDYDDEDEWEVLGGFSSGPPKYNDSPFGSKNRYGMDDDPYGPKKDKWSSKSYAWEVERMEEKTDSIFDEPVPKSGHDDDDNSSLGRSRNKQIEPITDTGEAQKKFGSAKAISSDQYFGDKGNEWHHKQNLARFEGSSSISSADYFGDGKQKQSQQRNFDYSNITPDISGLKEGVKDGVTKVAGRISNLANNVVSTIQDRYT